jgi:hypothetical protein
MTPKDYTVYIDDKNQTRAVLTFAIYNNSKDTDKSLTDQGYKVIGKVSVDKESAAIDYGDQVLR